MMDSTCLLMSKSYSSADDGQYVPSHVKIIELPITSADDGEYMPSTYKSYSSPDDGQYVPSQVNMIELSR